MVPATEKREVRVGIGKLDQPMTMAQAQQRRQAADLSRTPVRRQKHHWAFIGACHSNSV